MQAEDHYPVKGYILHTLIFLRKLQSHVKSTENAL